jgi:hypothetical protein
MISCFFPVEVAASLLLQLLPCIKHATTAAAAASGGGGGCGSGFLAPTTPPAAWQHSASSSSSSSTAELAWLQLQLQLLVQPHIPARATAVAGACRASDSACSPCCQAGFVVLRNLTTLVTDDAACRLAADKGFVRGELRNLARGLSLCDRMHSVIWGCAVRRVQWERSMHCVSQMHKARCHVYPITKKSRDNTSYSTQASLKTADQTFLGAGLVSLLQDLIASSPSKTSRKLDWSGKQTGFQLTPAAAEPCKKSGKPSTLHPTAAAACAPTTTQSPLAAEVQSLAGQLSKFSSSKLLTTLPAAAAATVAVAKMAMEDCSYEAAVSTAAYALWLQQAKLQPPNTLLAAAMQLLLALLKHGGRAAATQLYACNVCDVLERLCGFCTAEVLSLVEKAYSQLCLLSAQLRDEVMQDGNMTALTGIIKAAAAAVRPPSSSSAAAAAPADLAAAGSVTDAAVLVIEPAAAAAVISYPLKLQLAALSRLTAAIDGAAGADIIRFTGPVAQPGSAAAAALGPTAAGSRTIPAPSCTAAAAASGSADEVFRHVAGVVGDGSSCGLAAVVSLMVGQQGLLLREAAGQVGLNPNCCFNTCRCMDWLLFVQIPLQHLCHCLSSSVSAFLAGTCRKFHYADFILRQVRVASIPCSPNLLLLYRPCVDLVTCFCAQVFSAVLSRCRLMQQLDRQQIPKGGLWPQLGASALRQLEALAANPSMLSQAQAQPPGTGLGTGTEAAGTTTTSSSSMVGTGTSGVGTSSSFESCSSTVTSSRSRAAGSRSAAAAAAVAARRSPGRRKAGSAASAAAAAGSSALAGPAGAARASAASCSVAAAGASAAAVDDGFDEDGLR